MAAKEMNVSAQAMQQLYEAGTGGNYQAQRQLDFRLETSGTLRIVSPLSEVVFHSLQSNEERDFQIAMRRRGEPEGLSLAQIGEKYGL